MKPLLSFYRLRSLSWVGLTVYSAVISADAQMTINRLITDGSLVPDRGDYVKSFTIEDTGFATLSGVSVTVNLSSPTASNPMWFGDMFGSLTHGTASESERMAVLFNRPGVSAQDPWGDSSSSLSQTYDVSGALAGAWLPSNRWSLLVSDSQQGGLSRLDSLSLTLTGSLGGNAEAKFRPGDNVSGSGAVNGQVNLTTTSPDASVAATIGASESLHFGGGMVGTANLVKNGGGELAIGRVNGGNGGAGAMGVPSANDYSGEIEVSEGSLRLIGNDALGSGARIKLGGGGVELRLDADAAVSNSVTLAAATTLAKVEVSSGSASISSDMQGAGGFEKSGAGTLTISGSNTHTGATNVTAGKLIVNGSTSGASAVAVSSGATLAGSGAVGGNMTVASGGVLAPGNSPGVLTVSGTTTQASGSIFEWELDTAQSDPTTNRGVAYDGINTTSLSGSGAIFKILLTGTQDFSDTFWGQTRTWTDIFKSADGITNLSDWASVFSGGFQYSYNGKTVAPTGAGSFALSGNSLTWSAVSAVPEPSSALVGLLVAGALLRRRREV